MKLCSRCMEYKPIVRYIADKAVCLECHTEAEVKQLRETIEKYSKHWWRAHE